MSMKISDWLTIVAIILAPLLAIQAQKWIEGFNEIRNRKLSIFRTLMSTRTSTVSFEHVQALNMIDIEFYGRRFLKFRFQTKAEREIVEAWKTYLDYLNKPPVDGNVARWVDDKQNKFIDLLSKIAKNIGYRFDNVHLKNAIYLPKAHTDQDAYSQKMREYLSKVSDGTEAIPIKLMASEEK